VNAFFITSKKDQNNAKALNANVDNAVDKLVFLVSLFILKPWSMAPVEPEGVYGSQEEGIRQENRS
jgi:hypothetical protein